MNLFSNKSVGYTDVSPASVAERRPGTRIIDVREPDEYRGTLGHIAGAELVPLTTLASACMAWPRDAELMVVCRSGGRSASAAATLVKLGFQRVHNMVGGMQRWVAEQRAIER